MSLMLHKQLHRQFSTWYVMGQVSIKSLVNLPLTTNLSLDLLQWLSQNLLSALLKKSSDNPTILFHSTFCLVSTYAVCERLSVMHKQVSVQLTSNSKFLSKFSRKPLSGISDQRAPPPMENFRFEMTSVYSEIPPPNGKLQIGDDQSLL